MKNFIKFFAVIFFLCISFTSCGSMVLEPDVYTHIKENDLIYYTEKGNERVCDPDSVIIGVRQDGRDRYACTERLQLYFHFVAGEDTKRFDLQSVKLKNLNTGEVIVTEENEGKVNPSRFQYSAIIGSVPTMVIISSPSSVPISQMAYPLSSLL